MSRSKVLSLNRRLLRSQNRPPRLGRVASSGEFPLKKIGWLEILSSQPCGYSGQPSTGSYDADDGCDNNDGYRTSSTDGNKIDNIGTDNSNRKGNIRNSPDRSQY